MKYKLNFEATIINMKHPYNKAVKFADDIYKIESDNYLKQKLIISIEVTGCEPTKELANKLANTMKQSYIGNYEDITILDLEYKDCEAILE